MRPIILAALMTVTLAACSSQPPEEAALEAAAKALGATAVNSIQYSGSGLNHAYGQAYAPGGAWPAFKVTSYTAVVDYGAPAMRVELDRTNPDGVVRGGGGLPLLAPQKQIQAVSGDVAWSERTQGGANLAAPSTASPNPAADRLRDIWKSPHGVIKAAQKAGTETVVTLQPGGEAIVTFPAAGTTLKATLNADHLVEKVEHVVDDPVAGDAVWATTYSDYKDFNGVKFPTHIVQTQAGFPVLDLNVTDVQVNPSTAINVPANIKEAAAQPAPPAVAPVKTTKLADGVFWFSGQGINTSAVEFRDHIVVWESTNDDALATARFAAIREAIPNKPIKYVISSHHHNDHLGGLRTAVAEGAIIITQEQNKDWFEKVIATPHTVKPDRLAQSPKTATIETVGDKRVLTDGVRTMELHRLLNFSHADTMLMAYLPKEKILLETDAYNPPAPNAPPPPVVSPLHMNLYDNLQRLKLDVRQIAPGHGNLVTMNDLLAITGKGQTRRASVTHATTPPRATLSERG